MHYRSLTISIGVLLTYLLLDNDKEFVASSHVEKTKKETAELLRLISSKYGTFTLERDICMGDGTCVYVSDEVIDDDNEYRMIRRISVGSLQLTGFFLKPPKDLKLENVDTKTWMVDLEAYSSGCYTKAMIDQMFLSGSVEMRKDSEARVLVLGMGGGFLNSYLHHNFPLMNITAVELEPKMAELAKKWFGLKLDRRHHLQIGDGMEFVRDAIAQSQTFDVVLMDACSTREMLCPIREAITESSAKLFSRVLSDKGALIVNVFSRTSKTSHIGAQLQYYYRRFFKHCTLRKSSILNMIFTCTQIPRPEGLEEKYKEFMLHKTTRTPNIEL